MKTHSANSSKLIYISGPMSGLPGLNFDAFDNAAKVLQARGDSVCNPADRGREWINKNGNRPMSEPEYRRILIDCCNDIHKCDGIYLLKGWENSRGAKQELCLALIRQIKIETEQI